MRTALSLSCMSTNSKSSTFQLHGELADSWNRSQDVCLLPSLGWGSATMFYFPSATVTPKYPSQLQGRGVGLTLYTWGPGPQVLPCSHPVLARRGQGQGRASWLGGDMVVWGKESFWKGYRALCLTLLPFGTQVSSSSPARQTKHLNKKNICFAL